MDAYKYGSPFEAITDLDKAVVRTEEEVKAELKSLKKTFDAQIGDLSEHLAAAIRRIQDFEEKNKPTPKKRKSTKDAKATTGET